MKMRREHVGLSVCLLLCLFWLSVSPQVCLSHPPYPLTDTHTLDIYFPNYNIPHSVTTPPVTLNADNTASSSTQPQYTLNVITDTFHATGQYATPHETSLPPLFFFYLFTTYFLFVCRYSSPSLRTVTAQHSPALTGHDLGLIERHYNRADPHRGRYR